MELEFFCKPGDDLQRYAYWKEACMTWLTDLGLTPDNLRIREHDAKELSFYSAGTSDIEYRFPWGFDEIWGIADRTDYDLKQHTKFSGESLDYLDPLTNERYVPYCVEPAVGVERLFLSFLTDAYEEQQLENDTRVVLHFHPYLAPYKAAILPLSKQLGDQAMALRNQLAGQFMVDYDETGSIGKRYRRQDAIGTPYCITVDFDTATAGKVTVRDRDTMQQERLRSADVAAFLQSKVTF
jgi:glycyl-tRNA synthetase